MPGTVPDRPPGLRADNLCGRAGAEAEVEGDAFFPLLPSFQWKETAREPQPAENGYRYDFVTYERA